MSNDPTAPVRWRDILTPQYALPLTLICLAVWLHAADGTLVATMLPAIIGDIGGAALVAWNVALYEVGSIVAGALCGLMAARHGTRLPMAVAATTFSIGCAISALAPLMEIMLLGRLVQGLGGGGLIALAFISVHQFFPERLTPRAIGVVSTLWGTSTFFSPLIGGLFVEYGSWRGGFWVFAAQAAILAAWILFKVPGKHSGSIERSAQIPWRRLALLFAGIALIAFAGHDPSLLTSPALILAGFVALGLFLWLDARSPGSRMLPTAPFSFKNPIGAALIMILCISAATVPLAIYGPLLMTMLHGASALTAGYIIALTAIGWSIASITVSGYAAAHDGRMIATGMSLVVVSVVGFAYAMPNGPLLLIAFFAVLEGAGFGMCWVFIMRRTSSFARIGEGERVAGAIPTVQRMGYALGAAYVGIVANAVGIDGATTARAELVGAAIFLGCIPLGIVGLTAMWCFIGAPQQPSDRADPAPAE